MKLGHYDIIVPVDSKVLSKPSFRLLGILPKSQRDNYTNFNQMTKVKPAHWDKESQLCNSTLPWNWAYRIPDPYTKTTKGQLHKAHKEDLT